MEGNCIAWIGYKFHKQCKKMRKRTWYYILLPHTIFKDKYKELYLGRESKRVTVMSQEPICARGHYGVRLPVCHSMRLLALVFGPFHWVTRVASVKYSPLLMARFNLLFKGTLPLSPCLVVGLVLCLPVYLLYCIF